MKANFVLAISLILSLTVVAQNGTSVIYNLEGISLRPTVSVSEQPTSNNFKVKLRHVDDSCQYFIDNKPFQCPSGNTVELHFVGGTIEQTDVNYPSTFVFSVKNKEGSFPSILATPSGIKILDASASSATTPSPSGTLQNPPNKSIAKTAQIAGPKLLWLDAINLEDALSNSDSTLMHEVLSKYFSSSSPFNANQSSETFKELYDAAKEIPFLDAVLPELVNWQNIVNTNQSKSANSQNAAQDQSVQSISSPTILLDVIATVISKRLVDELNMAYLNGFRKYLEEQKEAKTLFPKTTLYLTSFGTKYTADYKNLLNGLRQNIFNDLKALPNNGATYLKTHTADSTKTEHLDLVAGAIMGLRVVQGLQNDEKPAMIIHELGQLEYGDTIDSKNLDIISWVKLGARISDHFRVDQNHGNWISGKNLEVFSKNPRMIYLLAGLITQTESTLIKPLLPTLYDENIAPDQAEKVVSAIYQTIAIIRDYHDVYNYSLYNTSQSTDQVNGKYFTFATSLLDHLCKLVELNDPHQKTMIDSVKKMSVQLLENIHEKNFVAAGVDLFGLIVAAGVKDSAKTDIFRYLSFGQNLVDATTKEELIAAIEDAAAPVGSYQLKRHHPFTASITSFPGLSLGHETYTPSVNQNLALNNFGFTAPLGLAFSWNSKGKDDTLKARNSWSLFLPVLDVGALTYFRLQDQQADIPELQWKNFISPGAGLVVGLKKSPISFTAIAQYGPEAVSIDAMMLETSERLWRINFGINVDLHLWSIHTKP